MYELKWGKDVYFGEFFSEIIKAGRMDLIRDFQWELQYLHTMNYTLHVSHGKDWEKRLTHLEGWWLRHVGLLGNRDLVEDVLNCGTNRDDLLEGFENADDPDLFFTEFSYGQDGERSWTPSKDVRYSLSTKEDMIELLLQRGATRIISCLPDGEQNALECFRRQDIKIFLGSDNPVTLKKMVDFMIYLGLELNDALFLSLSFWKPTVLEEFIARRGKEHVISLVNPHLQEQLTNSSLLFCSSSFFRCLELCLEWVDAAALNLHLQHYLPGRPDLLQVFIRILAKNPHRWNDVACTLQQLLRHFDMKEWEPILRVCVQSKIRSLDFNALYAELGVFRWFYVPPALLLLFKKAIKEGFLKPTFAIIYGIASGMTMMRQLKWYEWLATEGNISFAGLESDKETLYSLFFGGGDCDIPECTLYLEWLCAHHYLPTYSDIVDLIQEMPNLVVPWLNQHDERILALIDSSDLFRRLIVRTFRRCRPIPFLISALQQLRIQKPEASMEAWLDELLECQRIGEDRDIFSVLQILHEVLKFPFSKEACKILVTKMGKTFIRIRSYVLEHIAFDATSVPELHDTRLF